MSSGPEGLPRYSARWLQFKYGLRLCGALPLAFVRWGLLHPRSLQGEMFWQRLGALPAALRRPDPCLLLDANGHGEYNQIHTFLRRLRESFPGRRVILMSWNPEIVELARTNPDLDGACFAPWDVEWIARRHLRRLNPFALIIVDQVRFPCQLRAAKGLDIPTLLVSASLSEVYLDSVHLRKALAYRFDRLLDRIGVAGEKDRDNYLGLGCEAGKLSVTGYMKYDPEFLTVPEEERRALKRSLGLRPEERVWIAGSVRNGEEALVLEAHRQLGRLLPEMRLILAPRYQRDVEPATRAAEALGFQALRRTRLGGCLPDRAVLVLDTYGELSRLYAIADVVFIGNSLVSADRFALGQNIIEPLVHRKPVFFGPFMNKWKGLTTTLKAAWPGLEVRSAQELAVGIARILQDAPLRERVLETVEALIEENRQAVERNVSIVVETLAPQSGDVHVGANA